MEVSVPFEKKIMEVSVTSIETIKPSSLPTHLTKPFEISLLDQITPSTYVPTIFFYTLKNKRDNANTFSTRLKASLSDTLTRFYPYSGRVKDNLYIHDFHEGVPYLEAQANCHLSDLLSNPTLSFLNHLFPYLPLNDEKSNPNMPQMAVQLTEFDCGGVSLGFSMSHKITDAATAIALFNAWAATARDMASENIIRHETEHHSRHVPDFVEAPSRFPGKDSLNKFYTSAYENVWFGQSGSFKTERFVFNAEALATLKARARSELVENPSRVQALSGFIWKCAMEASRKASTKQTTSPITHVMAQAVNIRRQRPWEEQPVTAIGNVFWWAIAIHYSDCSENKLSGLVELVNESLTEVNSDYMKSLEGEEGFELVTQHLKQIEEIYANEEPEIFGFTSWVNAGFKDIDFGWGKPTWQGMFEKVGSASRNLIFLIDTMDGRGIEAWITLDGKVLANLKNDPEFLALASVNPPVPITTSRSCL